VRPAVSVITIRAANAGPKAVSEIGFLVVSGVAVGLVGMLIIDLLLVICGAFANGVAFVALAPLTAAEQISPTIAEAIEFRFGGPSDPRRQLEGLAKRGSDFLKI
jgi:hypothetical protein